MTIREAEPADFDGVRHIFREYAAELGLDFCFQGFEEELEKLPGSYGRPIGALRLMEDGGLVGCGAVKPLEPGIAELKRIYIRPPHRGQGLGRLMVEDLLEICRASGYAEVRLDTLRQLVPANALYKRLGFQPCEPYNCNPIPDVEFYRLFLAAN